MACHDQLAEYFADGMVPVRDGRTVGAARRASITAL
jgi:hypothetical protein